MPKWGLSMKEGKLTGWLVEDGKTINPGEAILEVETDKIAGAVEAADGGFLRRRVGEAGADLSGQGAARRHGADADGARRGDRRLCRRLHVTLAADEGEEEAAIHRVRRDAVGPASLCASAGRARDRHPVIHGFGGDLDNWLFNIDALAELAPVYALDLPGHGQSTKAIAKPGLARWRRRSWSSWMR